MQKEIKVFSSVVKVDNKGVKCVGEKVPSGTLISEGCIDKRVKALAARIAKDFKNEIYCIVVLKGSTLFFSDLSRELARLKKEVYYDFIKASSYKGSKSTGELNIEFDSVDTKYIQGKDVLVIEDIVDTGLTLSKLLLHLKEKKPRSVKLCALLDKPSRRKVKITVDYVGFEIPDLFVVGFGLDYDQRHRCLPYVKIV